MAPRAHWKGFLRLSLVTCPVALYPATSDAEKISFNQINKKTGHRIKYAKVDAETGEEVPSDDIVKGYRVDTDTYIEVSKDELENVALESTRTIDIDEFVPKSSIDPRYLIRPYYLVLDGKVGHDAFAVIRETIRNRNCMRSMKSCASATAASCDDQANPMFKNSNSTPSITVGARSRRRKRACHWPRPISKASISNSR
jgi:Ku protein